MDAETLKEIDGVLVFRLKKPITDEELTQADLVLGPRMEAAPRISGVVIIRDEFESWGDALRIFMHLVMLKKGDIPFNRIAMVDLPVSGKIAADLPEELTGVETRRFAPHEEQAAIDWVREAAG